VGNSALLGDGLGEVRSQKSEVRSKTFVTLATAWEKLEVRTQK